MNAIYPWTEYLRPWKLFTLAAGIALLLIGALLEIAPDWDVAISLIMALLAYLTAPWEPARAARLLRPAHGAAIARRPPGATVPILA